MERKLTFEDETKIVGGNVVTDITVLTAAHCCLDLINDDVIVRTGALKVPPADEDGKVC